MSLPQLVLIVYIVFCALIAIMAGKITNRTKTSNSFLAAGRSLGWLMVGFSMFGSTVGGAQFVGVTANYYTFGMAAYLYSLVRAFAYITQGIFIAPKVSKLKTYVCNSFFGSVYHPRDSILYGILQSFVLLGVAASQIMVGAILLPSIFPALEGNLSICLVICTILFGAMALFGGQLAISATNAMHTLCIIICAVLISVIGILQSGGIGQVVAAMPESTQWFSLSGQSGIVMLGWFLGMAVQAHAGQTEWNAIASARDPKTARKGLIFNGIAQIIFGLIVITIGMLAVVNFPNLENSNNVFTMTANRIHSFCGALAISAIFAATASTAQGMFVAEASVLLSWVREYGQYKSITINDRQEFYISKIACIVFAIIAFIMSLFAYDLIRFVINVMSVMTPFSILLLLTLYRPQFMRRSMCTTLFVFCIVSLIPYFTSSALQALCGGMIIYPLLVATVVTFAVCRIFDKNPIDISNIYRDEGIFKIKERNEGGGNRIKEVLF